MILTALLYLAVLVAILAIVITLSFAAYIYYLHRTYSHIPGPKMTSFFLGNAVEFGKAYKEGTNHYEKFLNWYREFGSIYVVHVIHMVEVIVLEPRYIKDLVVTGRHPKPKNIYSKMATIFGNRYMGNGLVTETDHQKWFKTRKMMNPAFKKIFLKKLVEQYNEGADGLVERLGQFADSETVVTLMDEFYRVTLDFVARLGFGLDLECVKYPDSPFPAAMQKTLKGIQTQYGDPFAEYKLSKRKFMREVQEACRLMRKIGEESVMKRIEDENIGIDTPTDILSFILQISNGLSDPQFQMEEVLDNFITFFLAGHETTANLMTFIIFELSRKPGILQRLRDEIENVMGNRKLVEANDFAKLEYMTQVINETLRMYSVVPAISRILSHNVVYTGTSPDGTKHDYKIPAGTNCSTVMYVLGRIDKYFPDPETFNPDRFVKNPESPIQLFTYFPFSMGSRSCIGRDFALYEAKTILVKLLRNFDFDLSPDQTFELYSEVSLQLKDRCKVYIRTKN